MDGHVPDSASSRPTAEPGPKPSPPGTAPWKRTRTWTPRAGSSPTRTHPAATTNAAWAVLKGAPGASDETPLPGDPPTPNAAHLALVLLRRNGDFPAAVAYGLRYLNLFGSDERFAGRTLALLTLPTSEQDDSGQATLSAELQGRLEQELTGFFARYPDSQYLRRRGGRDAADLAEQINQEARPAPQQAAHARKLMTAVMRGSHPLGVLAALSSRPYAHCIVTRVAGVLSAVGGDDEHNAGIADASAILGILPAAPAGTAWRMDHPARKTRPGSLGCAPRRSRQLLQWSLTPQPFMFAPFSRRWRTS